MWNLTRSINRFYSSNGKFLLFKMECPNEQTLINGICVSNNCIQGGVVCSNDGTCKDDNKCTCQKNTTGQYCEKCADGYELIGGKKCFSSSCVDNGVVCNRKGICQEQKCQCFGNFTGELCDKCGEGFELDIKNRLCLPQKCMKDGVQCSGNGACTSSACKCKNSFSGDLCQCGAGMRQKDSTDQTCLKDNCQSSNGECNKLGTCALKNEEFVCDSCGESIFNDPNKGCAECIQGGQILDQKLLICTGTSCIEPTNQQICNNSGKCVITAGTIQCECTGGLAGPSCGVCAKDENMITPDCKQCKENYEIQSGKCVIANCFQEGIECSGNGSCDAAINQCKCTNSSYQVSTKCSQCTNNNADPAKDCACTELYIGEKCDECKSDKYLDPTSCSQCLTNFQLISGQCQPTNCYQNDIECSQHGTCDIDQQQCKCTNDLYSVSTKCSKCVNTNADPANNCACTELYVGPNCNECKIDKYLNPTNCTQCLTNFSKINGQCQPKNCFQDGTTECFGNGKCNIEKMKCDCINSRFSANCQQCLSVNADISQQCLVCLAGYSMIEEMCYFSDCEEGQVFDTGSRQCEDIQLISTGAVIGIAVGVVLLLVGVIVGIIIFCVKKHKVRLEAIDEALIKTKDDPLNPFPSVNTLQCQ